MHIFHFRCQSPYRHTGSVWTVRAPGMRWPRGRRGTAEEHGGGVMILHHLFPNSSVVILGDSKGCQKTMELAQDSRSSAPDRPQTEQSCLPAQRQ